VYVFENTGETEVRRPIRKVYLNRTYFTGLFRSRKQGEYLGDIKEPEGKKYLLFRVKGESEMEILARVVAN
jgi:site-specific DNA-adenine methylase